jgi:hypothetical protein
MGSVVAAASIVTAVTVAIVGSLLLVRLVKTMLELRKVTTGLNSVLGWALGHVLAEPSSPTAVVETRKLGPG